MKHKDIKTNVLSVRVTDKQLRSLEQVAAEEQRTTSNLLQVIINGFLSRRLGTAK
jgi:hypothetical protein